MSRLPALHARNLRLTALGACLVLVGCGEEPTTKVYAALDPAPPVLKRLTQAQYEASIVDLLGAGLTLPSNLEPDLAVEGLLSVGASISTVSKRGVEQYEAAARSLAGQLVADKQRLAGLLPCVPNGAVDVACLTQFLTLRGRLIWRRPLTKAELARLVAIGTKAATTLKSFDAAIEYSLAALLQSPHFLYRVELGGAADDGKRALTQVEFASRLSYFLWNGPPDALLLDAATNGALATTQQVAAHVDRMLADAKLERAVRAFFGEWLHLGDLDDLGKDPTIYKHFSADLGRAAREETLRLATSVVLKQDASIASFLTARTTSVTRRLAAIYNIKAPVDEGFGEVTLPAGGERQGFLGQVSFLALNAHPVSTSATLRGIFVREALLCQSVPAPPAGVNTMLPAVDPTARTMRERLELHMSVPECKGCHSFTDPIGFGMENLDGIGRWRATDDGAAIDATGELEGETFGGFRELTQVIANSKRFHRCVPEKLFSFAMAHHYTDGEEGVLTKLTDDFVANGSRIKPLMRAIAISEVFRRVGPIQMTEPEVNP